MIREIRRWDNNKVLFTLERDKEISDKLLVESAISNHIDLSYGNFNDFDLSYGNFHNANFNNANFNNANFNYTNFNNANFNNANFHNANFNNANFNNANFNNAKFNYAKFNYAKFNNAKFNNAEFHYAEFNNITGITIHEFNKLYKYPSRIIIASDVTKIIMGCYERTEQEWRNDFYNNEKEFPKGSPECNLRLKAINILLGVIGKEPIEA